MIQKVLIAIDPSPQAVLALKVARSHFPQAERHLLTVIDERDYPMRDGVSEAPESVKHGAERLLRDAAWPGEHWDVRVGEPVRAMLHHAEQMNADLLVIGTHGRRGLNRLLSGSVAEELIRQAGVPVMVVREARVPDPALHHST